MPYLTRPELEALGFRSLGASVLISSRAAIYDAATISIGDYSRVDDFAVVSGLVSIGRYVHVTVHCNLAGGRAGITMDDFTTLAYGCNIVAQTDDYSGRTMTNSNIPGRYKNETSSPVRIGRHSILGTGTVVLPGVTVAEGTSTGAQTLLNRSTEAWSVYVGTPGRRLKSRSRDLLELEREFLQEVATTDPRSLSRREE